jgi:hypothetical protein
VAWQKSSSKVRAKWQNQISGMPIYVRFGMLFYLMLPNYAKWQRCVSQETFEQNRSFACPQKYGFYIFHKIFEFLNHLFILNSILKVCNLGLKTFKKLSLHSNSLERWESFFEGFYT